MARPTEADLDKDIEVAEEMHRMAVEATHVPTESMLATSVAAVSASRAREIRRLRAILDRVYESCTAHDPELDAEVLEIRQERRGRAVAEREAGRA